jgi:hypothetical protein
MGIGFEPSPDPLVIVVIEKDQPSGGMQEKAQNSLQTVTTVTTTPVVKVGDTIVAKVTARWIRHKDSTKLPSKLLKPSQKTAKEIPLNELVWEIREHYLEAAKVLQISRDGLRCFVRHAHAHNACYHLTDVAVVPQENSHHANG